MFSPPMPDFTGRLYIDNAHVKRTDEFNTGIFSCEKIIYEVIRVQQGAGVFLEDHLIRLQNSAKMLGYEKVISQQELISAVKQLIIANDHSTGNIKLLICLQESGKHEFYAFYIPHFYPSTVMYRKGIDTALFNAVRTMPNVKITTPLRKQAEQFINKKKVFEVLLVSEDGSITEGSKSNVFFITGHNLITPPAKDVLKGITRSKVIEICNRLNFNLSEIPVSIKDLSKFSAVFITGTSSKVIPVRSIDNRKYSTDHIIVKQIYEEYNKVVKDYVRAASQRS